MQFNRPKKSTTTDLIVMISFFPSSVEDKIKFDTVEHDYSDIDVSVTTFIASGILWYIIFLGYNNTRL